MRVFSALFLLFLTIAPARADIAQVAPSGFTIHEEAFVSAPPERAWQALTQVQRWWSSSHTYSGRASNLSLQPRVGGCWCERWGEGSVEHARVVLAMEREGVRTLRLDGAFGPLQELGAHGLLSFTVSPDPRGAKIALTYRVAGDPALALDRLAEGVDGVMRQQLARLARLAETGSAE